jgi:hypothetical protein
MSFDSGRLRRSERISSISAIALLICMFLFKWYGVSVSGVAGIDISESRSGWDVFTNSRWVWLITIIVALAGAAITTGALEFQSPIEPAPVTAGLGALSTLLILYRIVHHPLADVAGFHAGIKIGIWLALIAAGGIAYGGYLAMQEEGTS